MEVNEAIIALVHQPISMREMLEVRARAGSKTFDKMELGLYFASLGFIGIWFASTAQQKEQPKLYMKQIVEGSYLKHLIKPERLLTESVDFVTGGKLRILNLTEDAARSPRADFIIYDEEARADVDAYNAAVSILSNSDLRIIIHISTARKGTLFEKNMLRLKRREMKTGAKFVFARSWFEIGYLARNKIWYEEERIRLRKEGREWEFRQEHECSFELPTGAIFKNVITDVYDDQGGLITPLDLDKSKIVSGIDWNPVGGHCLISGVWTKNRDAILITEAKRVAIGYTHELKEESYLAIKAYATYGKRLCCEGGGINEEYKSWLKGMLSKDANKRKTSILWEEWDSAGTNKTNACLYLESVTIYVDAFLFDEAAEQIENAHWREDSDKVEVAKDPVDSPHFLDAFLHATNKRLLKEVGIRRSEWYGSK